MRAIRFKRFVWTVVLVAFVSSMMPYFTVPIFAEPEKIIKNVQDIKIPEADNEPQKVEKEQNNNPDKPYLDPRDMEIPKQTDQVDQELQIDEKFKGQTFIERMVANLFSSLTLGIYHIFQLKDPLELIFDYGTDSSQSRDKLHWGVFNDDEMGVVSSLYKTFEAYLPLWLFVAIVLAGLLLVFAGFGGDPRLTAKQYISGIFVMCVLFAFGPTLFDLVFEAAYTVVDIIQELIESRAAARGIEIPHSLLGVLLAGFFAKDTGIELSAMMPAVIMVTGLMYAIILFLVFVGAGVLNWQYIVRKITLAVLIFMFPVCAGMAVFPNTRGALKMWFSEFFANVFLVSAHAVVYGFLILIALSPGRAFTLLEIIIFLVGLNGTVGIVRGMFGAHQSGRGIIGGMGSMLGLSSLIGVGRMALGLKGSHMGLNFGGAKGALDQTASRQGKEMAVNSSLAANAAGINKAAELGSDFTPAQASLIDAQMSSGVLSDEQRMELEGPQKSLNIQQQMEDMNAREAENKPMSKTRRAALLGGSVLGASVGALLSGAVTGQATPGLVAGGLGLKATNGVFNTAGNIKKAIKNPHSMGIYSAGQMLDAKSAVQIGRNIGGRPGAAAGWAVNKVVNPLSINKWGIDTRNERTQFADNVRTNIANKYSAAQQQYLESQQKMQMAQHHLQELDLKYPVAGRESNPEYQQELTQATNSFEEAKNQFNVDRLNFKEAEMMKQNEHDYVGIQMRMAKLSQPPTRSSGHIN